MEERELRSRRPRPDTLDFSKGRKPRAEPENNEEKPTKPEEPEIAEGTFWLTRIVFLRSLAFIYFVAFLVAYNQNKQLLGDNGLLPIRHYMDNVLDLNEGSRLYSFFAAPSIFWWAEPWDNVNPWLDTVSIAGMTISALIILTGAANMLAMVALWLLYHSLVNVGQRWYGFGWESQLLETGFLSIWLVPAVSWSRMPPSLPSPGLVVWGNRWLLFRIMVGAGLIKLRGDACWKKLTCMHYHYETQPVPNPLSYYLHYLPGWWHAIEVLGNHFVELVVPSFAFLSRPLQLLCGGIQIAFQAILIASGNLSFLNWLTILPSIWLFDDRFLSPLFASSNLKVVKFQQEDEAGLKREKPTRKYLHKFLAIVIAYLSVPVVINLLSPAQRMNTSFEPFRIVNTYGAFGSITKERGEVILQGTHSDDPHDPSAQWLEYEFKCKPGNVSQAPCLISPYHYRLDWLMWFAAFQDYQSNPWLVHLSQKLLRNDPEAASLLARNPFEGMEPPKFIRAELYQYQFARPGQTAASVRKQWWTRRRYESYMHPVSLSSVPRLLDQLGYPYLD